MYDALTTTRHTFWDHVYPMFLNRDITRRDLRHLITRALSTTAGNYRAVLALFGMHEREYKRFLNFLAAHDCTVDFRPFRAAGAAAADRPYRSPDAPPTSSPAPVTRSMELSRRQVTTPASAAPTNFA